MSVDEPWVSSEEKRKQDVDKSIQSPESYDHSKGALVAVAAERQRQQDKEGWTPEHDDKHIDHQLTYAAMSYILGNSNFWPWDLKWWKPSSRQRDLVKAAALIIAEIERLDRDALTKDKQL